MSSTSGADDGVFSIRQARYDLTEPLSAASRDGLRAAASPGPASDEAAERAARLVVADARDRAVTVETMIIAVKREWSAMAEVRAIRSASEARALLDRLVSRCIDAFYDRR